MNVVSNTTVDFSKVSLIEAAFIEMSIRSSKVSDEYLNAPVFSFSSKSTTSHKFNVGEKGIKVEINVSAQALGKDGEQMGMDANFVIGFTYHIDNLEDYLIPLPETEELVPGPMIVVPLIGAAYSTARGMIIMKVLGTRFEGFSMPIVNALSLLKPPAAPFVKKKRGTRAPKEN